jgi:hypothetical protein
MIRIPGKLDRKLNSATVEYAAGALDTHLYNRENISIEVLDTNNDDEFTRELRQIITKKFPLIKHFVEEITVGMAFSFLCLT